MLTPFNRLGDSAQRTSRRARPATGRGSEGQPRLVVVGSWTTRPAPSGTAFGERAIRPESPVKSALREAAMKDCDPVSPYLKRPIRSVEEAQRDLLANGNLKRIILRAITESRSQGRKPTRQFQDAVDALLLARPDIEESLAVKAVHRTMSQEKITSARNPKR
jgi:hypothetical protein